jgi:hypothetical protein
MVIKSAPTTAESFDLGPSFEEEREALRQAARNQETAVLQSLFEDNRKLQNLLEKDAPAEQPRFEPIWERNKQFESYHYPGSERGKAPGRT